jgi:hypothetical protein
VFCARGKKAGGRIFRHPQSRISHHEGVGSGVRTRRIRRRHIVAFHSAAYRWFCEHHGFGPMHPVRLATAAGLTVRAACLMAIDALKPEQPSTTAQLDSGRPEGGVAL